MKITLTTDILVDACVTVHDSYDLEFVDSELIQQYNNQFYQILQKTSFKNISSTFSEDELFYYKVERYVEPGVKDSYEVGIGSVYTDDGKKFLERVRPIFHGVVGGDRVLSTNGKISFAGHIDSLIIATQYIPTDFHELLYQENSIIYSSNSFFPAPLLINNDSVVGRLGGDVDAVPIRDILQQETDFIQLSGKTNKNAKKGALRYNDKKKRLEYHDGKSWNTIAQE